MVFPAIIAYKTAISSRPNSHCSGVIPEHLRILPNGKQTFWHILKERQRLADGLKLAQIVFANYDIGHRRVAYPDLPRSG